MIEIENVLLERILIINQNRYNRFNFSQLKFFHMFPLLGEEMSAKIIEGGAKIGEGMGS